MIIKEVTVTNYRSVRKATLPCESMTVLVGPNGAGKSAFLRALELFYATTPRATADDFYDRDVTADIEIAVTYTDLADWEKERFAAYLDGEELTVLRVLSLKDGRAMQRYHGYMLQNPDFAPVKEAAKAPEKKVAYEALRAKTEYECLPKWAKMEQAAEALRKWETDNKAKCERQRDDGQFFGFTEVGQGYLGQSTRFIFIPAVRDANDDAQDAKGSPTTAIMDLVVRSAIANRPALKALREETQKRYEDLMDPAKLTELAGLEGKLSQTLKSYVPDASVSLSWQKAEGIEIPMPRADVRLVEDGYPSAVGRTGHGLQRTFILTMLQHLALATPAGAAAAGDGSEGEAKEQRVPNLILGVEEPELYQHPNRQRHFAKVLARLASGAVPGVAGKTQVLYGTHSPLFVGIDRFHQIRALRKAPGESAAKPKVTTVIAADGDAVAEELWNASEGKDADGKDVAKFTWATLQARLHAIMTPWMNEGFFADVAVLVEGEDDRAAILGAASAMGHELETMGISVIPCGGKTSIDRPAAIFRAFGIPVYAVWDGDKDAKDARPFENQRLLRLMGSSPEEWPSRVEGRCACFRVKLEATLEEEIGKELFDALLQEAQVRHGIRRRKDVVKNPTVIGEVIAAAKAKGRSSGTLEEIVKRIVQLRKTGTEEEPGIPKDRPTS